MKPVALVTGASGGLGAALARSLAADGFHVVVHYRSRSATAEQVVADIRASDGGAESYAADLADESQAQGIAEWLTGRFGALDLLVNNAGIYRLRHGLDLSQAEWFEGLNSTVTQTFFTSRACLPLLRTGGNGRIVNIGDSSCDRASARDLAWSYHIGKTGVWMLTRSLAVAEAPHGVAVNMVSPGLLDNSIDNPQAGDVPAGRLGRFADVHGAVRWLALEAPAYLTGSNLVVSGGWNLR